MLLQKIKCLTPVFVCVFFCSKMGIPVMVTGQHSDLCFGDYTHEITAMFDTEKKKNNVADCWSLVFGDTKPRVWDLRKVNQAYVQINNADGGESEFVIQGEPGLFIVSDSIEVITKTHYTQTNNNLDIKTMQRSNEIAGAIAANGSDRFVGYSQDTNERNATFAAIECVKWARETATTVEKLRDETMDGTLIASQKKSLRQQITRDTLATGANTCNLISGNYYTGPYATTDPIAHDAGGDTARRTSARWALSDHLGYQSAANIDNTIGVNNRTRTYKLYDIMNDSMFTKQMVPCSKDTKIRVIATPRRPVSVANVDAGTVAGVTNNYTVRVIAVTCKVIRCQNPDVLAEIDRIIGANYFFPCVSVVGMQ